MTTVKQYQGIDIYLDGNGKFTATVDGKVRKAASIAAIEKIIDQSGDGLVVVQDDYGKWKPRKIVGIKKSRRNYGSDELVLEDGSTTRWSSSLYLPDAETQAVLDALRAEAAELDNRQRAENRAMNDRIAEVQKRMVQVTGNNYHQIVLSQKQKADDGQG